MTAVMSELEPKNWNIRWLNNTIRKTMSILQFTHWRTRSVGNMCMIHGKVNMIQLILCYWPLCIWKHSWFVLSAFSNLLNPIESLDANMVTRPKLYLNHWSHCPLLFTFCSKKKCTGKANVKFICQMKITTEFKSLNSSFTRPTNPKWSNQWIQVLHFLSIRFWSQVVYDPGLHESLESYLSRCHRWYEMDSLGDFAKPMVESLHQLVFLIYVRMATHKESKVSIHWITLAARCPEKVEKKEIMVIL